jgi:hypothetical protein
MRTLLTAMILAAFATVSFAASHAGKADKPAPAASAAKKDEKKDAKPAAKKEEKKEEKK